MSRRRRHRMATMNVVPYIDVMLVLLIIFMITSPLLVEGVNVELPKADEGTGTLESDPSGDLLLVTLDSDARLYVQDEFDNTVSLEDRAGIQQQIVLRLRAYLERFQRGNPNAPLPIVYLRAHKDLTYQQVVDAMSVLRSQGLRQVTLVVEGRGTVNP